MHCYMLECSVDFILYYWHRDRDYHNNRVLFDGMINVTLITFQVYATTQKVFPECFWIDLPWLIKFNIMY